MPTAWRVTCAAALATIASLAGAPTARASGFAVTAQDRHVGVANALTTLDCVSGFPGCSVVGSPVNSSDSHSAPDFAPFSSTATVPGGFSASQTSSLSSAALSAQGSGLHSGAGYYDSTPPFYAHVTSGSSDSHFAVSFDVASPTPYRLQGRVSANGGLSANSTSRIRLRTAGGTTIAEVVAATDPDCQGDPGCALVGPLPLEQTAVLAPGSYVLEASTSGDAQPFFFAQQWLSLASTGDYEVTLALVEVPALGPGALALLGLALAAAPLWLRRSRRPARAVRPAEPAVRAGCRAACARAPCPRA